VNNDKVVSYLTPRPEILIAPF